MRLALLAVLLAVQPHWARAGDLRYLGEFHDVSSSDGGDHCSGHSLGLWQYRERVLGLLDLHVGPCGDPPCGVIADATWDPKTGRLEFRSHVQGQRLRFEGTVTSEAVEGELDGVHVRLPRERDATSASLERNGDLSAWCEFWAPVGRCEGVRELCESLPVRGTGNGATPRAATTGG